MQARSGKIIITILVVAAVIVASWAFSVHSLAGKSKKVTPHQLTIIFTGDDWGNVKPCG